MQKSKEREYPIPFHNDVFFKYMLIGEDAGSAMLRSRIIEEIYGLKVQKTQVLNPELLPEAFFGKRAVLDVVLEDETGHLYDLEMQVSGYTKEEQLRFQQYGYRLVGRQLKQGNDYTKLKPFYQIIFMNYKPKDTGRMIRHYTVKDEDNREEPNGTLHRAIVFLPMIRQRVKEVGGIENLTEFETFCYVLAYNPDDAILNMKRRMVNVAMKKIIMRCARMAHYTAGRNPWNLHNVQYRPIWKSKLQKPRSQDLSGDLNKVFKKVLMKGKGHCYSHL